MHRLLAERWGLSLARCLGRTHAELGYPSAVAEVLARHIAQVFARGRMVTGEVELPGAPADRFEYLFSPIVDAVGRIEQVVAVFRDITERYRAHAEAEASRIYAESIVDTIHEPLLVLRPDLTVQSANPAFYQAFQVGPAETLGRRLYDLGNGQWAIPALRELLEDVLPDNHVFHDYLVRHEFEGLGERVMLVNARRLGHVQLILLGLRDITAQQQAEAALTDSEERLRLALEAGRMGTWQYRPASDEQLLDPVMRRLLGLPPEAQGVALEAFLAVIHEDDRAAVREAFAHGLSEGGELDLEFRVVQPDGTVRWLKDRGQAVGHAEGEPRIVTGAALDITERREAEALLEQRVAERTAALEQQTRRLRRLARELTSAEQRERERLAALLHDELQQLLVAAQIQLGLARNQVHEAGPERALAQTAELISEALRQSRDLTRELRPPALYEAGLVPALRSLAAEVQQRHGLEVTVESPGGLPPINDDLGAFCYSAVRELLLNVVKHAAVSQAAVSLSAEGRQLSLTVADRGRGLVPELVLEPTAGRGIGLYSLRERLAAEPAAADPGEGLRVLVVDDHAAVRAGFVHLLGEDPRIAAVDEASDGAEALEAITVQLPDVVLMDLNMLRMNGVEATRAIVRRWPEVSVIGLTVQDDPASLRGLREAGARNSLSRTAPWEQVHATVLRVAQRENDQAASD